MKRLFILFAFFPLSIFSQTVDSSAVKKSRFSLGVVVSPAYSYRVLECGKFTEESMVFYNELRQQYVDTLNAYEEGKVGFTFGISLDWKFARRLGLRTGFYYSDKGVQARGFIHMSFVSGYSGFFKTTDMKRDKFFFYEVPLSLSFHLNPSERNKVQAYVFAGVTACLNSRTDEYETRRWFSNWGLDPNGESSYDKGAAYVRDFFYAGYTGGLGCQVKATERITLNAEPVFKYYPYGFVKWKRTKTEFSLSDNSSHIMVVEKPYSIGCNIGASIRL